MHYSGKITHNEKTITLLYRTQYYSYEKGKIIFRLLTGFFFVAAAVFLSLTIWARGILIALGTWLIVSTDFPAQIRADKVVQARKNSFPEMNYEFYYDKFKVSGEGSMNIAYKKLTRLIEDEKYYYLFIAKNSVCMIEKASIKNDGFAEFIAKKTKLQWRREKSLLAMNLQDVIQIFKAK